MKGKKTEKEKQQERNIKAISALLEKRGLSVRREKLARGSAFRVKSGKAAITGKDYLFVDKRLPIDQQSTVLNDCLLDIKNDLTQEELEELPENVRHVINS